MVGVVREKRSALVGHLCMTRSFSESQIILHNLGLGTKYVFLHVVCRVGTKSEPILGGIFTR